MDLTDAVIILRNATDAGTEARDALDFVDDYTFHLFDKQDELEAEIERLNGLLTTATARIHELEAMLDGLSALVEAVKVAEYPVPNNTGRTLYVGQSTSVFVQNPASAQGYGMSAIEYTGRRMHLDTARRVAVELLRACQEVGRLKAEYAAQAQPDAVKG